ncbi:MAG: aldehyde dehydrogenase family protein [Candidatus Dormibacteria bacterium]|jgi:acyl-CoA reductase-like NAD-dependent aldehyde dehydrogenase
MPAFTIPYPPGLPLGDGWVATGSSQMVRFPYDDSDVASAPVGDRSMAQAALEDALRVAPLVADMPTHRKRAILNRTNQLLRERRREFVDLLVLETGKPKVDCGIEVDRSLVTLEVSAEEAARLHGETVALDLAPSGEGLFGFWIRRPIGVVIGIAWFNYPLLLATHKIAPAIAAGCPVIAKPAPQTPLATLWLVQLFRQALLEQGAPAAWVQLVTGDADVGRALITDPRIGAVSFTGSAAVGHQIARDAAPTKTLLELGSNSALVVCSDANLDRAADAVLRGGYYASGQACISVQRVIVVESVMEKFLALLDERLAEVVVGDPRSEATRVSALIDSGAGHRVGAWVGEAVAAGARVVAGGEVAGATVAPTLLADVPEGIRVWDDEVFGPVVCVRSAADEAAAFSCVNRSRYGLQASVFTGSLETALRALRELEVGGVVINEVPGFRADNMPYGGVKDSGIGREGPRFAAEELTVTRMAVIRSNWEDR